MKIKWNILNRKIHYWGSIIIALPILIVIITGVILLLKKDVDWIQPPSAKGQGNAPTVLFEDILASARTVEGAEINDWSDIDRLDIRPKKGIVKLRAKYNDYEIQLDHQTAEVLQVAIRRSDWIEALHDGSFFHKYVKYSIFLPSSIVLFVLWVTGIYLFVIPLITKKKKSKKNKTKKKLS